MKTTTGELRNITTGILHTNIGDVYHFLEQYLDSIGIMTHQLPSACRALEPILKSKLDPSWFQQIWIKEGLDTPVEIPDLTEDEKKAFWESYGVYAAEMWNNIKDKTIAIKL